jgi:pyruvate ferredoxin oxidoreductase gamma subunit
MYRIRFHGRGGQGIKTASRILGTALFLEGFEVQDAPHYGAERRGAPIFAYVRADRKPIAERGPVTSPDLVVVADDTLVGVPTAGVLQGLDPHTLLVIDSSEPVEEWANRLNVASNILVLPKLPSELSAHFLGAACAGAAAALLGRIERRSVLEAVRVELADTGSESVATNEKVVLGAFDEMAELGVQVEERADVQREVRFGTTWIDVPRESADASAPVIHGAMTSIEVRTGLWRTMRPVIDRDRCRHCWWVCSTFCPDDAISVSDAGEPIIDYDHCKGCMICVAQCPPHAIEAVPEATAAAEGAETTAKRSGEPR